MASCELCGRDDELLTAFIEGVKLKVCSNCSKYGKVIENKVVRKIENKRHKEEVVDVVISDYSNIMRKARESKGLNQRDLALNLNERESTISKIEQGSLKPSLELAKKLEKFFNVKLIEKEKISETPITKVKNNSLTIGDFLKK